ncbi:hypothetical protein EIP86_010338 [Pleurotus ostreatoroseus]|nr:hypothetical protein EIP86_010338 [Pleurotus ostreatoroseus]
MSSSNDDTMLVLADDTMPARENARAGYIFTATQDWFSFNIDSWRALFPHVKSATPRILEIGSWEGRSAVFLLDELCSQGGSITCIDHFDLMHTEAGSERHRKLTHNLSMTGKQFRVMDQFSVPALMNLLEEAIQTNEPGFDWVYVDGSHRADDTFLDAELAWRLTNNGAVFIFDDYGWDKEPVESIHHPKRGIDAFMQLHAGEFDVLSSEGQYQMIFQKTTNMHIGFLTKTAEDRSPAAFDYGVHVALTADASYAMPATVAIQSVIAHTPGRVSFYVVDLGLSLEDKAKIRACTGNRSDVTLQFLQLPAGGLTADDGPVWAKVDILDVLPVERVLYLDADVLVRTDLQALWETDLQGKSVGACYDVGHPMGHEGVERGPYFNAGVMLLDLAKVRAGLPTLRQNAQKKVDSPFKDQDVLNDHFRDDWYTLPLQWNAQGLGTYAKYSSEDRQRLDLAQMQDSAIVHFTGPINPSMQDILNKWVQPYTAKPWGYAGAPGHPFAEEWWTTVDQTEWRGWRSTEEYREYCAREAGEAMATGSEAFRRRVRELGITI